MKFGDNLNEQVFGPWRHYYIQYDYLKYELKKRQLSDAGWTGQDEQDFIRILEAELDKVYDFVTAKLAEVEARVTYCERTLHINAASKSASSQRQMVDDTLTEALFDINDLAKFTRLNYTGFQKILKKHDKWTGINLHQGFIPKMRAKPLDKQRFDVPIIYISALHDICRNTRTASPYVQGDDDGDVFERATAKYWVHPDNITEVKAILMLHLPVYLYDSPDVKQYKESDSAISSVYFDNSQFELYTGRLQRDEGAEAIRIRWYGDMDASTMYVERKTHHAPWTEDRRSLKERFQLDVDQVPGYLSGQPYQGKEKHMFVANGVQQSIREKHLKPMLRVFYHRTAFQIPKDQRVRVSLDTDLTFIKETNRSYWRRPDVGVDYPFPYLDDDEIIRFPYAILETKVQTHLGQDMPDWLSRLVESHLVHETPRFSKYLHGASTLFREQIPLLPWWLSELTVDILKPRDTNFGLSRSASFKPLMDGQYLFKRAMDTEHQRMRVVSMSEGSSPNIKRSLISTLLPQKQRYHPVTIGQPVDVDDDDEDEKRSSKQGWVVRWRQQLAKRKEETGSSKVIPLRSVKVEPKVFFANERTFISWLQFCGLLLMVALNLLNFGDHAARIAGSIFICIAAVVALYALYRFEKRAWMINRRVNGRYDDLWGPIVLCVLLVGALIVNFYLQFGR
ncbi:VTC domain-containing protein [Fennellomyces sp. T-0311]|nr:VTC domain-containing protein [Fennellomyces sp. T-0311]